MSLVLRRNKVDQRAEANIEVEMDAQMADGGWWVGTECCPGIDAVEEEEGMQNGATSTTRAQCLVMAIVVEV